MTAGQQPDQERLLRIGTFSRQARLSLHQLRHYHELGLLLPASVDPESGYRYYTEGQMAIAGVIAILRAVDMPLVEIRELLRDPSPDRVQETLDRHRTRLESRLAEARYMLSRLRELMKEGISMSPESETSDLVRVVLEAVRVHTESGQHALILREQDGERALPIWVGPSEASAAAGWLQTMTPGRPMTHDLVATMFGCCGATVDRAVITRLEEEVYYATIHLICQGSPQEIDARPSDAVNVAIRAGAPIFVASAIMDERAVAGPAEAPHRPPRVIAMAVDADTGHEMGPVYPEKLPEPGDEIDVPVPTALSVVSVEPAHEGRPALVRVRRPSAG